MTDIWSFIFEHCTEGDGDKGGDVEGKQTYFGWYGVSERNAIAGVGDDTAVQWGDTGGGGCCWGWY